jgi:acetoin utilization deacetylase AcuC-like enzyme
MSIPGPVPFPAKPPDPLAEPLVVYGEANHAYDFGDAHPFTPRRFGPGIDLLRALGATRFAAPVPVTEAELETVHRRPYIELVRMLSDYPEAAAESGFDDRDTPPFYGMHDATAGVVGGTVHALDRILAGDVVHAFHPGGGLHHAFPSRAGGFCVYNDLAVAIRRAGGRWLATGAGGYEVYRVVPRSWALVWLAQAHRDVPAVTPSDWRERWSAAATRHAQGPPPVELLDPPGTAPEEPAGVAQRNGETAEAALEHTLGVLAARHGPGSA